MCNNNEKQIFDENNDCDVMQDFDAVSLYPSAMIRLVDCYGIPKGKPKLLTNE